MPTYKLYARKLISKSRISIEGEPEIYTDNAKRMYRRTKLKGVQEICYVECDAEGRVFAHALRKAAQLEALAAKGARVPLAEYARCAECQRGHHKQCATGSCICSCTLTRSIND